MSDNPTIGIEFDTYEWRSMDPTVTHGLYEAARQALAAKEAELERVRGLFVDVRDLLKRLEQSKWDDAHSCADPDDEDNMDGDAVEYREIKTMLYRMADTAPPDAAEAGEEQ